uniref:Glutamate--cysteine ligase n=1 Tax=Dracunculus medinensis TaxID=318479 RepID=A0A0N4UKH3_DRAME
LTELDLVRYEIINDESRLTEIGLSTELLENTIIFKILIFTAIGLWYEEICGDHPREFWYTSVEDAKKLGIEGTSLICDPFIEELYPSKKRLMQLSKKLNEIVQNTVDQNAKLNNLSQIVFKEIFSDGNFSLFDEILFAAKALNLNISKKLFERHEKIALWLSGICADYVPTAVDEFDATAFQGVEIDGPIGINITALEIAGVNLTELAEKLRNDTEVDELLARTTDSTRYFNSFIEWNKKDFKCNNSRTLGGSFILPVLQKNQYDPFSAPIVFQGSAVVVRFGIYIESMSNFHTETMVNFKKKKML